MGCNLVSVDSALAPTIQRLVHENATLREAFNDANRRLSRLEDEKLRFFDEGIFDLVNSVCGKSTAFNKQCEEASRGWSYDPPAVAMSPSVLSTGSTVRTQARRSEEERRSAALSDENEELRRQLAHASEVGEVLEQQHQAAEDRMHALEQEHAWLAERLSRVAGANGAEALPPLPALPSTLSPASPPAVSSSAAPHSEAREATRAVPSCADGILRDAWHEPQSAQVAALAAERAQLEALERRLRDTEARAQMLAEEYQSRQLQYDDRAVMAMFAHDACLATEASHWPDASYCHGQQLSIENGNNHAQEEHGEAVGPRFQQVWMPNVSNTGVLLAVLFAALAGLVPFTGLAVLAYWGDADSAAPSSASSGAPPALPPPAWGAREISGLAGEIAAQFRGELEVLRLDLRRQADAQAAADSAIDDRLRRLQNEVASGTAGRSVPSTASGAVAIPIQAAISADPTAGLGVDWAAWPTGAEIDQGHTSPGVGRDIVGRSLRLLTTVLPRFRAYTDNVSHAPEVVLASDGALPTRCFVFEGNGSMAVRFARAVVPGHVAIEQPPSWAATQHGSTPRHFQVRGWSAQANAEPYGKILGSFENLLDGPRVQVFPLAPTTSAAGFRGVQFVFGRNWGEAVTSVCRLRVLGHPVPLAG